MSLYGMICSCCPKGISISELIQRINPFRTPINDPVIVTQNDINPIAQASTVVTLSDSCVLMSQEESGGSLQQHRVAPEYLDGNNYHRGYGGRFYRLVFESYVENPIADFEFSQGRRILEIKDSNRLDFPGGLPVQLEFMGLYNCNRAESLPDDLPSGLAEIVLESCTSLTTLFDIWPPNLKKFTIKQGYSLVRLPDHLPESLQRLKLIDCPALTINFSSLPRSLLHLDVTGSPNITLPERLPAGLEIIGRESDVPTQQNTDLSREFPSSETSFASRFFWLN